MFEMIQNTDGVEVRIEPYRGTFGPSTDSAAWVTIAAGNVLPELLLRVTTLILSSQGIDIFRAHLDTVHCAPLSSKGPGESANSVTMLRLIISPDPVSIELCMGCAAHILL